jgi:hypothetical protein
MLEFIYDVILPITVGLILISGAILITALVFIVMKEIIKK